MRSNTFKIALGGLCLALAVIFMFGAAFVPGIDMTLFAISSLFTVIMILETGIGGGLLLYAGASILGLILVPAKLALIPYICFFGYYGVLKFYIEKIKSCAVQISLKLISFAALLCLGLLAFRSVLAAAVDLPDFPVAILIIGGMLLLLLYDYILTFLINFYRRRFGGKTRQPDQPGPLS